jgi:hypothetical protein
MLSDGVEGPAGAAEAADVRQRPRDVAGVDVLGRGVERVHAAAGERLDERAGFHAARG